MKIPSPTHQSMRLLAEDGWTAQQVEYDQRHSFRKTDLWGFVDIIAIKPGRTLAVQTTDTTNVAARVRKINASPYLDAVRAAGWEIVVHGWYRDGRVRVVDLTAA